ncbi:MAG: RidA family protein [Magnetococcales bacterium]|nr:RidA family protein [Magnetococcales bacterium]MBF0150445.1 RidA family protein [Magnetococcales bacterium]MBF0172764.1 RidA family protein [Magnetococcales bacterium]MBF0347480.1 RidA family protein [Magnetococcales bacterium]MBF0630045.1 RidA family protein [Magnetococcales bacterium]
MIPVQTGEAPAAVGPYSQAVRIGDWLYLSGQIALIPATGALVAGGVEAQVHQVMKHIGAILRAAGADYGHLVKTTLYLVDLNHFAQVNEIYAQYVRPPFPARSTLGVGALPKGGLVAVDGVAWLGQ